MTGIRGRTPGLWSHGQAGADLQAPMDAAVVIPTMLRPSLARALRSVFAQKDAGRIHILVGIDVPAGDRATLARVCEECPRNCVVQVFDPGFSTAARHGGLHPARDGGVLRCVLTYLANSRRVAYLDDDNWWASSHLADLRRAMDTAHTDWAYARRWFVHPASLRPVCIDRWESVGPGAGVYAGDFGGAVDPNCLMLDKLACAAVVPWWNVPVDGDAGGMSADRNVFHQLKRHGPGAPTGDATVFYKLDPSDGMHNTRMQLFGAEYGMVDTAASVDKY